METAGFKLGASAPEPDSVPMRYHDSISRNFKMFYNFTCGKVGVNKSILNLNLKRKEKDIGLRPNFNFSTALIT